MLISELSGTGSLGSCCAQVAMTLLDETTGPRVTMAAMSNAGLWTVNSSKQTDSDDTTLELKLSSDSVVLKYCFPRRTRIQISSKFIVFFRKPSDTTKRGHDSFRPEQPNPMSLKNVVLLSKLSSERRPGDRHSNSKPQRISKARMLLQFQVVRARGENHCLWPLPSGIVNTRYRQLSSDSLKL